MNNICSSLGYNVKFITVSYLGHAVKLAIEMNYPVWIIDGTASRYACAIAKYFHKVLISKNSD